MMPKGGNEKTGGGNWKGGAGGVFPSRTEIGNFTLDDGPQIGQQPLRRTNANTNTENNRLSAIGISFPPPATNGTKRK